MKNRELLDPLVDVIFKSIFGNPKNTDILSSFIKSVLGDTTDEFERLEVSDTNLKVESINDKIGILDVKAYTKTGGIINIEVQVLPVPDLRERMIFYTSKMITEQIKKGDPYSAIKKVISIIVLDFKLIEENDEYHNRFVLYDAKTKITFTDIVELHTLELPKLLETNDNPELIDWLKFFKSKTEEEFKVLAEKSPELRKAYDELAYLSQDEDTRDIYESRLKTLRDEISRLEKAEKEGIKKGIKEGIKEGQIKGRYDAKLETAKSMLRDSMSIDMIAKHTTLLPSEIEKIKNEL